MGIEIVGRSKTKLVYRGTIDLTPEDVENIESAMTKIGLNLNATMAIIVRMGLEDFPQKHKLRREEFLGNLSARQQADVMTGVVTLPTKISEVRTGRYYHYKCLPESISQFIEKHYDLSKLFPSIRGDYDPEKGIEGMTVKRLYTRINDFYWDTDKILTAIRMLPTYNGTAQSEKFTWGGATIEWLSLKKANEATPNFRKLLGAYMSKHGQFSEVKKKELPEEHRQRIIPCWKRIEEQKSLVRGSDDYRSTLDVFQCVLSRYPKSVKYPLGGVDKLEEIGNAENPVKALEVAYGETK